MADVTSLLLTFPPRLDGFMMDMDNAVWRAEVLGIIQEQALELEKLKAEVNAVGSRDGGPSNRSLRGANLS
ncbi:unnamed protein product [Echinostoma caproni]|uniref:Rx_N domain-containing protein n=1 Tax=Echinostoma caproni TaxID=27848 RepID=A0A183AVN7_9TREM|nr:unnamed protein product [Echinostoma caproni]